MNYTRFWSIKGSYMKLNEALEILEYAGLIAEKTDRFYTQQAVDALCKKFNPDFGGLKGWSCEVNVKYVIIKHKDYTFQVQIRAYNQTITVKTFVGKALLEVKEYDFVEFDTFQSYMEYINKQIQTIGK